MNIWKRIYFSSYNDLIDLKYCFCLTTLFSVRVLSACFYVQPHTVTDAKCEPDPECHHLGDKAT